MTLLLYVLSLLVVDVQSYNLDVQNIQVFEDPQISKNGRPSYFGFSVALYSSGSDSVLLVGAPRANSSAMRGGFIEPGAVYSCRLASNGSCIEWPVNPTPQTLTANRNSMDYAWLGATISVQNTTKPKVVVCAPRWTNMFNDESHNWYPNGMCYSMLANDVSSFSRAATRKHMPMSGVSKQTYVLPSDVHERKAVYHQAMGQVGFSMHITPGIFGNLILGAPGFYQWTGTTVFLDERAQRSPSAGIVTNVLDDSHLEFNSYLGYSVTSGRFYKLSERLYASSAPRNGMGKVLIHGVPRWTRENTFRNVFEGEQYGEYFGASLTSCDVNGDSRDDLIIGAPLWSRVSDEGRVYVYKTRGQIEFQVQTMEGAQESGRFGTAVNCLNDLDFDGYADVAVGAPYEDDGQGAVYIFNGSPEGLSLQPSQRIHAVDLPMNLRGFGMSISEPRDVDGNRFPDVAFGAYGSGHALLIRSRPVLTLHLSLVKWQNFTLVQNSTYFILDLCAFYDGPFAPATFLVTKTLTIDEVHKRAIVYQDGRLFGNIYKVSNTLRKGEEKCAPIKINLKKNIQNVLDPIEIIGNIISNEIPNCSYCPVINLRLSKISDNLTLAYILDCGSDDVCHSDLQVTISSASNSDNSFIIGSNSTYNISIFVENTAEPAYESQAHLYIPSPITMARIPPECDEKQEINKTLEVVCSLGNPLRINNTVIMELDMRAINYYDESNSIKVLVTTQSEEKNSSNNLATLDIAYFVDANITIEGRSDEDLDPFEEQDIADNNFKTVTFNQIYKIWKIGVTPLQEILVIINVPIYWNEEKITKIQKIRASVDGKEHNCDGLFNKKLNSSLYDFEYTINKHNSFTTPSEQQIFFINCTDQHTKCQKFECQLGPLLKNQSLATLTVTIDFRLPNATKNEYKGKDVIYFVTEGFVQTSNLTVKLFNDLFDYKLLATNLLIHRKPEQVAIWIIIVSVLLGVILILLSALFLKEIGFFNRKRKEDLDVTRTTNQLTVVND
ncbi:integrin alpha-4-like [Phymastichus coffea]|uniref:integrin alpha-4-like n=1 Tax=Phymastichus coffea TaxID=108790 RepID=UPI00273A8A5C|nr:integrin alpha-4-like [Phymastichus coffea]